MAISMRRPTTPGAVQDPGTHLVRHGRVRRRTKEGVGQETDVTRPEEQRCRTRRFAFPK